MCKIVTDFQLGSFIMFSNIEKLIQLIQESLNHKVNALQFTNQRSVCNHFNFLTIVVTYLFLYICPFPYLCSSGD